MSGLPRRSLSVAFVMALFWTAIGSAQQSFYLFLEGKGTASLTISKNTSTAYIIDGGDKGRAGIDHAMIRGEDVLTFLRPGQDYKNLVIACSHPDSDHMAGLVKLVTTDKRILKFEKIFFVDSGFIKDRPERNVVEGGKPVDESLFGHFDRAHKERAAGQAQLVPAERVDAYATINALIPRSEGPPNAEIHNLVYEPRADTKSARRDPHGHSIVHHGTLRDGQNIATFADLDDANDARSSPSGWPGSGRIRPSASPTTWFCRTMVRLTPTSDP